MTQDAMREQMATGKGFIAALGQDIMDGNQDSHGVYGDYTDRLAVGAGPIFAVNALDNPTGSQDFADKFVARYPGWRELFWETAAKCGYWFDTTAPGVVTRAWAPAATLTPISRVSPPTTPPGGCSR